MRTAFQRGSARVVVIALVATFLFFATAHSASADTILGPNLGTFAILGGAGVTFGGGAPPSVITGSIGACCNATAITGAIPTDYTYSGGTLYLADGTVPTAAHNELVIAIAALEGMSAVSLALSSLGANSTSATGLGPGVYAVSVTDLNTTLYLDGGGNTNALWVFLLPTSLTTASNSNVILENTGAGAGVYWVMGASATLGANSTFVGNILADASISLGTNVTDSCGSLFTNTASVTLAGHDTVGIGCSGAPFPDAPEPNAFFYLAPCLAALVIERRRSRSKPSTSRA
jgi:hypothetical protein